MAVLLHHFALPFTPVWCSSRVGLAICTIFSFQSFRQYLCRLYPVTKITNNICITVALKFDLLHLLFLIQQPENTMCQGRAVRFPPRVKRGEKASHLN